MRVLVTSKSFGRVAPEAVEMLSVQPLEKLIGAEAATWLDRELVAAEPVPLRDAGFGHDAQIIQRRRKPP